MPSAWWWHLVGICQCLGKATALVKDSFHRNGQRRWNQEGDEIFRNQCGMWPTKSPLSMCSTRFADLQSYHNLPITSGLPLSKLQRIFSWVYWEATTEKFHLRMLVIDHSHSVSSSFFMYTILNGPCINGTEERPYNGRNTCGWPAFETWSRDKAPFLPELWSGAEKLLDFYINLFESKCSGLYRIRPLPCRKPRAWNTVGLQWRTAFMILTVIHISHRSTRPSFYLAASVGWRGKVFLDTNKNS